MNTTNEKIAFDYTQYDMLTLCVLLTINNQSTTDLIADFKTSVNSVKSKTDAISLLIAPEKQNSTGTAKMKSLLKNELIEKMFAVSNPFAGYAAKQNNQEWYNAFSKAKSTYKAMRPSILISQAANIVSVVTPLLASLTGTSITQLSLDAIDDASALFATFATAPRSKVVAKHDKLVLMVSFLNDAMNIMRTQCDKFEAGFVALGKTSFHNEWVRSRKLTPYGTLTTRASIDVFMGDANAPVKNAQVQIKNTPLGGTTDAKGHVTISRAPFKGPQFIVVTAPGFSAPVTAGPFTFKKGKATHIVINMNEFNIPSPVNENSMANA
jgi:hypothetical protein